MVHIERPSVNLPGCIPFFLVPIFAMAYYVWSDEFFAPYARFEPAAGSDRQKLGILIEQVIRTTLRYRSPNDPIVVQGWRLDTDSIGVSGADSENGSTIKFKMHASLNKQTPKGDTVMYLEIPVSFAGERGRVVRASGYNRSYPNNVRPTQGTFTKGPDERVATEKELYGTIFMSYGESIVLDEVIVLSEYASRQIDDFLSGIKGNPGAESGSLGRMFYFSSIVITTVGFGDILPLSPLARGLVAAEALLGIIVGGFFLNAVAHRAAGSGAAPGRAPGQP
jgi:hypothetical protein